MTQPFLGCHHLPSRALGAGPRPRFSGVRPGGSDPPVAVSTGDGSHTHPRDSGWSWEPLGPLNLSSPRLRGHEEVGQSPPQGKCRGDRRVTPRRRTAGVGGRGQPGRLPRTEEVGRLHQELPPRSSAQLEWAQSCWQTGVGPGEGPDQENLVFGPEILRTR